MANTKRVNLKSFTPDELIFDEEETRSILKFFFKSDHQYIDGLVIDDSMRGFAQNITIEAVDASYAIGYVKIIYNVFYMKPPTNVAKALKKFGKKAVVHWFKHAKATDLSKIKIYEAVRATINRSFRSHFHLVSQGIAKKNAASTVYVAEAPSGQKINQRQVWNC